MKINSLKIILDVVKTLKMSAFSLFLLIQALGIAIIKDVNYSIVYPNLHLG